MKRVVLLLLAAVWFTGCSTQTTTQQAQSAAAGIWSAEILGGSGDASGFSFTTQFTINANGGLNITYFQFLTHNPNSCFPLDGQNESGSMVLNDVNPSTGQVAGTFKYKVVTSGSAGSSGNSGNTLSLTGNVTGTEVSGVPPLTGGSITGTWTVSGAAPCSNAVGTFTMTQGSTTSSSSSSSSGS